MGSLSVSRHRGLVHWQGFLLVVSLLTFWSQPTTAKISVVPTYAFEGKDAVLCVHNNPPEAVGYVWYKGEGEDENNVVAYFIMTSSFYLSGPENDGRVILTNDGSLHLKNVTIWDSGMYTVVVHLPDSKEEVGMGLLWVFERLRKPVLLASRYAVVENEDALVLTCYTNGPIVQWYFNDLNLQFSNRIKLAGDRRRLSIHPVKREDAGVYKCRALNPFMWLESQPLKLEMLY